MSQGLTTHSSQPPLPQKNGIDPVTLILPNQGESPQEAHYAQPRRPYDTLGAQTVLDYMTARFYPHHKKLFQERFDAGEVKDDFGQDVAATDPLKGQKIWYYRQLPHEDPVPTDLPILYEDQWILVVDKPHFLNTAPNGTYVANTALTLLRVRENNPLLTPIHRLDRHTAGVLIFAKTQEARAPFQTLFQNRQIQKTYKAIGYISSALAEGQTIHYSTYIKPQHRQQRVLQLTAEEAKQQRLNPNAHTQITCLNQDPETLTAHYLLKPSTGKTHQLRAQLWSLQAPIIGDPIYRNEGNVPASNQPLQLLAQSITFTHPITQNTVTITSQRKLNITPN